METKAIRQPAYTANGIKFLVGCFVAALGVVLTLDNLNVIHGEEYLAWWPVLLVAIGVVKLIGGSRIFGVILVVAGLSLTAYNIGVIHFTIFDLWPLILIAIGLGFVARAFGWSPDVTSRIPASTTLGILSARKIVETSRDFSGRRYVAFVGSCEVDLTGADIASSPAEIETIAVWGAVEITVPDGWEIVGEVVPVMGGFEVNVRPGSSTGKQLIVRGAAVMGGVEIKSAPARTS